MIRTLVSESDPIARLGIRSLLASSGIGFEVDEACDEQALAARLAARYYELVIVEPAMGADGLLVQRLCERCPWSAVLVFTSLDELVFGIDAIRGGAKGYLMKTASADAFQTAVRRVSRGALYFSAALAAEFAVRLRRYDRRSKRHASFSKREFEVFSMAACGMTVVESAHVLQLDAALVGAIRKALMDQLQLCTQQDLAAYAQAEGLLAECRHTCSALWRERFVGRLPDAAGQRLAC